MNNNIGPNALTSRLVSSLIKSKVRGEPKSQPKEGIDLVGIAQKLFAHKQEKEKDAPNE